MPFPPLLALLLALLLSGLIPAPLSAADEGEDWVYMPAGARPTYFGIHGGTMPVSLLVSDDGAALVSFVGLTGNDFLNILYRMDRRVPSLFNGTSPESRRHLPGRNTPAVPSGLTAGGGEGSLPVFHSLGERSNHLLPFGFSETPLPIEGHVMLPSHASPAKRFRLFIDPKYLQPR